MDEIERLHRLIRYLAKFAEEQGADFGGFADAEPDEFDYELLLSIYKSKWDS